MYDDNSFLYERDQNRRLRLEKIKLLTNDFSSLSDDIFLYKNITPPTSSNSLNKTSNIFDVSKETDDYLDYIPSQCPICFDTIWRDTNIITCFYCDKTICFKCYTNMDEECAENNKELLCPLCRGLFIDYSQEQNMSVSVPVRISRSARNRERIVVPINEEEILQQEHEIREENDRIDTEECVKATKIILFLFGLIMLIIFILLIN